MTSQVSDPLAADGARAALTDLRREVAKAVVGQDSVVTGLVIALLTVLYLGMLPGQVLALARESVASIF